MAPPARTTDRLRMVNGTPAEVRTEVVAMPSSVPSADMSLTATAFVTRWT